MDYWFVVNLITRDAQITSKISSYDMVSNLLPLARGIESLIQESLGSEGALSHSPFERQIVESLLERSQSS